MRAGTDFKALRLTTVQILLTHTCINRFITTIPSGAAMIHDDWQNRHSKGSDEPSHVNLASRFQHGARKGTKKQWIPRNPISTAYHRWRNVT